MSQIDGSNLKIKYRYICKSKIGIYKPEVTILNITHYLQIKFIVIRFLLRNF